MKPNTLEVGSETIVVQEDVGQYVTVREQSSGFHQFVHVSKEAAAFVRIGSTDSQGLSRSLGHNNERN